MNDPTYTQYLNSIYDLLVRLFNLEELGELCFRLGLSLEGRSTIQRPVL